MERLINKKYKMLYPSESKLIRYGFRRVRNADDDLWRYTFPVYKHNHKITTIEGIISVELPSGKVTLDVYTTNGSVYTPFYSNEYGNYEVIMNIINSNILRELNKLNIKEKKKRSKSK